MVVAIHDELEGRVWNVFVPQMPRCSVLFVHLFIGASSGVQFIDRSCHARRLGDHSLSISTSSMEASSGYSLYKYTSPREQPHMLLLFQGEDTERS